MHIWYNFRLKYITLLLFTKKAQVNTVNDEKMDYIFLQEQKFFFQKELALPYLRHFPFSLKDFYTWNILRFVYYTIFIPLNNSLEHLYLYHSHPQSIIISMDWCIFFFNFNQSFWIIEIWSFNCLFENIFNLKGIRNQVKSVGFFPKIYIPFKSKIFSNKRLIFWLQLKNKINH